MRDPSKRSTESHREQHARLHTSLDQLIADYFLHFRDKTPSDTTISELLQWSHLQTIQPDE